MPLDDEILNVFRQRISNKIALNVIHPAINKWKVSTAENFNSTETWFGCWWFSLLYPLFKRHARFSVIFKFAWVFGKSWINTGQCCYLFALAIEIMRHNIIKMGKPSGSKPYKEVWYWTNHEKTDISTRGNPIIFNQTAYIHNKRQTHYLLRTKQML